MYTITQNTSFLLIASVLQKIVSFFYFTIIARIVGVENTGVYFFAIAFSAIFAIFGDFGLSPILTRESSRQEEKIQKFFSTVFTTKLLLGILAYAMLILFANLLGYPELTKTMIYIAGITTFFDNVHVSFYSVFKAKQNLKFESIGIVCSQIVTLVIGTIALFTGAPLYWLILAYTIPSILNAIYISLAAYFVYQIKPIISWEKEIFKNFILMSLPIALAGIANRLYNYTDTILMSKILSARELGWWGIIYKMNFALHFIPLALSTSAYPVISKYYILDKQKISDIITKSFLAIFVIGLPVVFGILAVAGPVVTKLYTSEYAPAIWPLRIMVLGLIFAFLNYILGTSLNGTNRQKSQTGIVVIGLASSVALNLYLLPKIGIMGASIASAFSNLLIFIISFYLVNRFIKINHKQLLSYFFKIFISAGLMGILAYYLSLKTNIILMIIIPALFYLILLFAFKIINKEIINNFKTKLKL